MNIFQFRKWRQPRQISLRGIAFTHWHWWAIKPIDSTIDFDTFTTPNTFTSVDIFAFTVYNRAAPIVMTCQELHA